MTERREGLGLLCFYPARAMEARVMDGLREAGYDDITLAQSRVFARVAGDGIRLTELAAQARVTKQTATFLVDQLEKAGYVERIPDPRDGRARLVRLGKRATGVLQVAARIEADVEREWRAHLGADRARELRDALLRLREITDPVAE